MADHKFEKLTRDDEKKTKIFVGKDQYTVDQLEKDSKIGRKLKSLEEKL